MLTLRWAECAISSVWDEDPDAFVRLAYLTDRRGSIPDELLLASDGDSANIRRIYEPLFALIAGIVNVAVGCDLTYVVEAAWHEACQFLLLDLEPVVQPDGTTRQPSNFAAFQLLCDPCDLTFDDEAQLAAFVENAVKLAVSNLTNTNRAVG